MVVIYFYWPETARLSLEEIGKQFGDEVAVHVNDATDEEKAALDRQLIQSQPNKDTTAASSPREIEPSDTSKGEPKE